MNTQEEKRPHRVRNDCLLIGALLLIAALGVLYLFVLRPTGNTVTVTVDGKPYATCSLSDTAEIVIESGEDGTHVNRLIIRDGKAFMEEADCPDGICVAHRAIFRDGESIVCLPNRVVVTVTSREQTDAPDIVV